MEIRLAKSTDMPRLLDYFTKYDQQPEQFARKRLGYYIDNGFVVIATEGDEINGHLLFQAKESPLLGVGEFEGFHIIPGSRGKGGGKAILERGIKEAGDYFRKYNTKMRCLYVMTRVNNNPAIRVYESAGFKKQGLIGKIFADNEPEEMVMAKFFN